MGQRRSASIRALGSLWPVASSRLRGAVAAGTVLSAIGKLLPVLVAWRIAAGDARGATVIGAVGLGVLGASRVVSSGVRVTAECDLHRAVTRALLDGDVLTSPTSQPVRALFEPLFNARTLLTETMPELIASVLAAALVAPIVATALPARALLVSAIAVVAIMVVLVWLSRISATLQARIWKEQEEVLDRVGFTIESRLELVARGGEAAALDALDGAIERYRNVARRGAWGAALLGRAPLAAGLVVVVVIVLLDSSYREAVTTTVLAQALVLAACLPIGLGVVTRINELLRSAARVAPLLAVLSSPARPELARAGAAPPALPAVITARDVTFAYAPDLEPTLRGLSFDWQPGTLLIVEGPNGAGKSTLLRLLLGLRAAQSGALNVGGRELAALDLPAFRKGVAYLPQRPYLGEAQSTVRSALQLLGDERADEALMEVLARVGLATALAGRAVAALEVAIGELSAGQRQRVALARVLLRDASIYLLDEPDANLDRDGVRLVGELVSALVRRGRMVAIAAHTTDLTSLAGTRVTLE